MSSWESHLGQEASPEKRVLGCKYLVFFFFLLMFLFKGGTAAQRLLVFLVECATHRPLGMKWPSLAPHMLHQQLNLHQARGCRLQGPSGWGIKTEAGSVDMEWMGHISWGIPSCITCLKVQLVQLQVFFKRKIQVKCQDSNNKHSK